MRQIPKSRILENQYTNGTGIGNNLALRFVSSKIPYIGFYSVISSTKYFSGAKYTEQSTPLEKYDILAAAASLAGVSGIATKANSLVNANNPGLRYFYKDLTKPDIFIKEIDKDNYNKLNGMSSMTYQVISYNPETQTLEEVNQQMPGLTAFLVS
jgi:hypothetical protein